MQRQKLEYEENEDRSDTEEEKPVVVVLKTGDLTAEEFEEVDMLKKKLEGWCLHELAEIWNMKGIFLWCRNASFEINFKITLLPHKRN